jgi:hypothetical protein
MEDYSLIRVFAAPDLFEFFRDERPVGGTAIPRTDGSLEHKVLEI